MSIACLPVAGMSTKAVNQKTGWHEKDASTYDVVSRGDGAIASAYPEDVSPVACGGYLPVRIPFLEFLVGVQLTL
ncbi:MAG: hypothetical protein WCA35_10120 [Kovacikia sp.]